MNKQEVAQAKLDIVKNAAPELRQLMHVLTSLKLEDMEYMLECVRVGFQYQPAESVIGFEPERLPVLRISNAFAGLNRQEALTRIDRLYLEVFEPVERLHQKIDPDYLPLRKQPGFAERMQEAVGILHDMLTLAPNKDTAN